MKRSNLIGGIIFLALAALFTVLNLALPDGDVTFMYEGQNMPWVPPVVMLIIGFIFFATGYGRFKETNFRIAHMGDRTLEEVKTYLATIDELTA